MLIRTRTATLLTATLIVLLSGCDTNDGPAEMAGEKVDRAVERGEEQIEDAGDKVEDATDRR